MVAFSSLASKSVRATPEADVTMRLNITRMQPDQFRLSGRALRRDRIYLVESIDPPVDEDGAAFLVPAAEL